MDKTLPDRRIVSAQLLESDVQRMRELAERSDRSLSAEIRRAVHAHVRSADTEASR